MKIVTAATMRRIDQRSIEEYYYTDQILMESAAFRIWRQMRARIDKMRDSILFLCGTGNNGGDGFAIARCAHHEGYRVTILYCARDVQRASDLNRLQRAICIALSIPVHTWKRSEQEIADLLSNAEHVVDALTGVGMRERIDHLFDPLIAIINESAVPVYAIDTPTGICDTFIRDYPAIRATVTYTVELPKLSCFTPLTRPCCGEIAIVSIGFPRALLDDEEGGELLRVSDINMLYKRISPFSYKHRRGVVACYAGNGATSGAAIMAADGASAAGAGLIHIFPNPNDQRHLAPMRSEYIIHRPETHAEYGLHLGNYDALCIGPGWGIDNDTRTLFYYLIRHAPRGVIDADGITILSSALSWQDESLQIDDALCAANTLSGWILTPHIHEFARLVHVDIERIIEDPLRYLQLAAQKLGVVIILKTYITYIAHSDGSYAIFDGGEASLATAGSGDVLAGIAAALLAQKYDPFQAAKIAVLAHFHGGCVARQRYGYYRASRIAEEVAKNMITYG